MLPRTLEPEVMESVEEAVDYDQMDHSTVNQLFVNDLLTVLRAESAGEHDRPGLQIVDVGTGTLQIPIRLVQTWPACGPVSACDRSVEMLRVGVKNLQQAGLMDRILPVLCDARCLPLADASVDVLMSNSIVHHIAEPLDVFQEVRRCLRPGGVVFFRDLLRPESEQQVEHLVSTYAAHENPHARQMFRQSLHAALTLPEVRQLLQESGLDARSVLQTSDRHWTVSCRVA